MFGITDENGRNYVLGLRDLPSKSSDDFMAVLKEIIADLDARCAATTSDVGKRLLSLVRNTMSDRASTEIRFNNLLEAYVNETLPLFRETRESDLEPEDVNVIIKLNQFFCGVHSLVHFAENAVEASLMAEKAIYGEAQAPVISSPIQNAAESLTARLIREGAKALARGADERNGIYRKAITHLGPLLKEKYNTISLPIASPLGDFHFNRVNFFILDFLKKLSGMNIYFISKKIVHDKIRGLLKKTLSYNPCFSITILLLWTPYFFFKIVISVLLIMEIIFRKSLQRDFCKCQTPFLPPYTNQGTSRNQS